MAEALESLFRRHDAGEHGRDQCGEGDDVVPPPAPGQQGEDGDENGEDDGLVDGHRPSSNRLRSSVFKTLP